MAIAALALGLARKVQSREALVVCLSVLDLFHLFVPSRRRPDLEILTLSGHNRLAIEARELTQVLRHKHTPDLIHLDRISVGENESAQETRIGVGQVHSADVIVDLFEIRAGHDHQTTVEALREVSSAIQQITKARRSEERRVGKECRSRWSPY